MMRRCARCGNALTPGVGRVIAWRDAGSGPGAPSYTCPSCDPGPQQPAFVGRRDAPPLRRSA